MKSLLVNLEDELLSFVEQAVQDGNFDSADHLFAYAIGLVRTESVLGRRPSADPPPPLPVAPPPKPGSGVPVVAVDLTRKVFDGPAFMADLGGRLEKRKDEGKPQS
jgi:hypothetical protein